MILAILGIQSITISKNCTFCEFYITIVTPMSIIKLEQQNFRRSLQVRIISTISKNLGRNETKSENDVKTSLEKTWLRNLLS